MCYYNLTVFNIINIIYYLFTTILPQHWYYKIIRLCVAIVLLLYYFTVYYPLSITRTNQYKHYYVQELSYKYHLLKLYYYY